MEMLAFSPFDGDSFWSLDLLFNLLWKSTLLWLIIKGLAARVSARQAQWVWRIGLMGLLTLFLLSSFSIWEIRPSQRLDTFSTAPQQQALEDHSLQPPGLNHPVVLKAQEQKKFSQQLDPILTWIWSIGLLLILSKALLEYLLLQQAKRQASVFALGASQVPWQALLLQAGVMNVPNVLIGKNIPVPLTFGWRKATILLPAEAKGWPGDRLNQILLHELIHIQRRDYLFNILSILVKAIYWFNPLSWVSLQQFRLNREWACDETLILLGTDKYTYAESLLAVATLRHQPTSNKYLAPYFAKPRHLSDRISRLLFSETPPAFPRWQAKVALGGLILLLFGIMSINLRTLSGKPYSKSAYTATIRSLQTADDIQRTACLQQLGQWGHRNAFQHITPYAVDSNPEVRISALWAAQQIGCIPAFRLICHQLEDENEEMRAYASALLETYPSEKLQQYLLDHLHKESLQDWFLQHFEAIEAAGQTDLLAKHLGGDNLELQPQLAELLRSPRSTKTLATLLKLLKE